MNTMAVLQSDDPCAFVLGRSLRVRWVDDSMGRGEVQHDRDFKRWEMPLMQWRRQEAITRQITKNVIAESRLGRTLRSPPAAQIRSMAADFDTG